MTSGNPRAVRLADELTPVLTNQAVLEQMEALSRRGRPAVEAIGKRVRELAPDLDDAGKQHVGRLVRDALAVRGWRPVKRARVAPGNLFAWGAVYARTAPDSESRQRSLTDAGDGRARMERARAMIREMGITLPTVDEFLAERRRFSGE